MHTFSSPAHFLSVSHPPDFFICLLLWSSLALICCTLWCCCLACGFAVPCCRTMFLSGCKVADRADRSEQPFMDARRLCSLDLQCSGVLAESLTFTFYSKQGGSEPSIGSSGLRSFLWCLCFDCFDIVHLCLFIWTLCSHVFNICSTQ